MRSAAARRALSSTRASTSSSSSSSSSQHNYFNVNATSRIFVCSYSSSTPPAFQQTQVVDASSSSSFHNGGQKRTTDGGSTSATNDKAKSPSSSSSSSAVSQLDFAKLVKQPEGTESPLKFYERLAEEGVLQRDEKQVKALHVLDKFYHKVMGKDGNSNKSNSNSSNSGNLNRSSDKSNEENKSWFQKLWERTNKSDASTLAGETSAGGVYLYGGPGCGKTFVSDLFMATLPKSFSKRVHFHAFMMETHGELHRLAQMKKKTDNVSNEDTVKWFADSMAAKVDVLCLDEFQVTDVADAMIIRRLLDRLWENNVRVVCTSNRAPDELYKNGLNRKQFLPCIEGIKSRMQVHDMDSVFDYRMIGSVNVHGVWKTIGESNKTDEEAKQIAHDWLEVKTQNLAGERTLRELEVAISGRSLRIKQAGGGVARIEFDELCNANLGPSDYVALCSTFHAIGIENIPKLSLDRVDLMRRFITFIDCAYEHKVKLIITAYAKHPDDLLVVTDAKAFERDTRDEFFAWNRAKSRLNEMQTDEYTKSSWRPKTSKWLLEQSFSLREKINVNVLRGLWQRYDKTKNGVLDESELAYLLADLNELKAGHRHVSKDQLDHSLRELTRRRCGSRGDGFVTFDDFVEYGRKGFDKIELPPEDHEKIRCAEGDLIPSL